MLRRRARLSSTRLLTSFLWALAQVAVVNFPRVLVDGRRPSRLGLIMTTLLVVPVVAVAALLYVRARVVY